MKHYKSERLKKLEIELNDLEQWLKLGLVPNRELVKHKDEILTIKTKIDEEKERLQFLKESGESEDYVAPKRSQQRGGYTEMPTLPDVDIADTQAGGYQDTDFDADTENGQDSDTTTGDTKEYDDDDNTLVEEESYFSDKNRWRRGKDIIDPEANEW